MSVALLLLRLETLDTDTNRRLQQSLESVMSQKRRSIRPKNAAPYKPSDLAAYQGKRGVQNYSVESWISSDSPSSSKQQTPVNNAETLDAIPFVCGNPFVEKVKGILHLYKQNDLTDRDSQRSLTLCILNVPGAFTSHDLLKFLAPVADSLANVRIVRGSTLSEYMVLLQFRSELAADEFYTRYNDAAFNSIEDDICRLAYVAEIECIKQSDGASLPVEGHTELPTCAVCLERMDESVDGVLTVMCNHSFHSNCLAQWGDTSCPVCRYCQTPENVQDQRCQECGMQADLWICLICGNVGCGRYESAHAFNHFQETGHTYSLQVGGQRVWDYAGDNYVHRLIQNKTDGKLVEYGCEGAYGAAHELADLQQEEKLDAVTLEYTYLLTSQLESQRVYYEELIRLQKKNADKQLSEAEGQASSSAEVASDLTEEVVKLRAEVLKGEKKLSQAVTRATKMVEELKEEREMNRSLRKNQTEYADRVTELEEALKQKDGEVKDLEEQVRDIMFHVQAQERLKDLSTEGQTEVQEGTVTVGEKPQTRTRRKKK